MMMPNQQNSLPPDNVQHYIRIITWLSNSNFFTALLLIEPLSENILRTDCYLYLSAYLFWLACVLSMVPLL
jgi:hypothetical protein